MSLLFGHTEDEVSSRKHNGDQNYVILGVWKRDSDAFSWLGCKLRDRREVSLDRLHRRHGLRQCRRIVRPDALLPKSDILLTSAPLSRRTTTIDYGTPTLACGELTLVHLLALNTSLGKHLLLLHETVLDCGRTEGCAVSFGLLCGERGSDVMLRAKSAELSDGRGVCFGKGKAVVLVKIHGEADGAARKL